MVWVRRKNKQQIAWYIKKACDHLATLLPDNPRYARMVVQELNDRLLLGRQMWRGFTIAAVAGLLVLVADRYFVHVPDERILARIVQISSGEYRIMIIEHEPGRAYRIIKDTPISRDAADRLLLQPRWREEAIAEYR